MKDETFEKLRKGLVFYSNVVLASALSGLIAVNAVTGMSSVDRGLEREVGSAYVVDANDVSGDYSDVRYVGVD